MQNVTNGTGVRFASPPTRGNTTRRDQSTRSNHEGASEVSPTDAMKTSPSPVSWSSAPAASGSADPSHVLLAMGLSREAAQSSVRKRRNDGSVLNGARWP
jgi:hypothetical protein